MTTDYAWAAGIVDGEGCIYISHNQASRCREGVFAHTLWIHVSQSKTQNGYPMLERLHAIFGGHLTKEYQGKGNRRPVRRWCVGASVAEDVLRCIRPYLIQKLRQADIALEYRKRGLGKGNGVLAAAYSQRLREAKR